MASYSTSSSDKLRESHPDLQTIFNYVIQYWDNTIVTGGRNRIEQTDKYQRGLSTVKYPYSKHNSVPSMAIDSVPYPSLYRSRENLIAYGGFVMGVASMLKAYGAVEHELRWGHDWNMDDNLEDNDFDDTGHFELI